MNKASGKKFAITAVRHISQVVFCDPYCAVTPAAGICHSLTARLRLPRVKIFPFKLALAVAAASAAICFEPAASHAGMYGDSRWCAVSNQGPDALNWDYEYDMIEDCRPAVLTGNRGFCAMNPFGARRRIKTDANHSSQTTRQCLKPTKKANATP